MSLKICLNCHQHYLDFCQQCSSSKEIPPSIDSGGFLKPLLGTALLLGLGLSACWGKDEPESSESTAQGTEKSTPTELGSNEVKSDEVKSDEVETGEDSLEPAFEPQPKQEIQTLYGMSPRPPRK